MRMSRAGGGKGGDSGGEIDVAAIEIPRSRAAPSPAAFVAFRPEHLQRSLDEVEDWLGAVDSWFPARVS